MEKGARMALIYPLFPYIYNRMNSQVYNYHLRTMIADCNSVNRRFDIYTGTCVGVFLFFLARLLNMANACILRSGIEY